MVINTGEKIEKELTMNGMPSVVNLLGGNCPLKSVIKYKLLDVYKIICSYSVLFFNHTVCNTLAICLINFRS